MRVITEMPSRAQVAAEVAALDTYDSAPLAFIDKWLLVANALKLM
jgi:hypothetical protein